jgi:hypothetical protein
LKIADKVDPKAPDLAALEALNCALEHGRPAIANTFPLNSAQEGFDRVAVMDSQGF